MKRAFLIVMFTLGMMPGYAGFISLVNLGAPVTYGYGFRAVGPVGPDFFGQFYVGKDVISLEPIGEPQRFLGFGLINAGVLEATGPVAIQLHAWKDADSWEEALERGLSEVPTVIASEPPAPPKPLAGIINGFQIALPPELSSIALLGFGALFLTFSKLKHRLWDRG